MPQRPESLDYAGFNQRQRDEWVASIVNRLPLVTRLSDIGIGALPDSVLSLQGCFTWEEVALEYERLYQRVLSLYSRVRLIQLHFDN